MKFSSCFLEQNVRSTQNTMQISDSYMSSFFKRFTYRFKIVFCCRQPILSAIICSNSVQNLHSHSFFGEQTSYAFARKLISILWKACISFLFGRDFKKIIQHCEYQNKLISKLRSFYEFIRDDTRQKVLILIFSKNQRFIEI